MKLAHWLLGGMIGGAIGGAIWVAVGYYGNYEVGWIAWGIGLLVGLGVRIAAGEEDGVPPGVVAIVVAVLAIAMSKYLVISLAVSNYVGDPTVNVTDQDLISEQADQVAEEWEAAGQEVKWPDFDPLADIPFEEYYPADVWEEGKKRWQKLTPEQQKEATEQQEREAEKLVEIVKEELMKEGFSKSFTPWDLLWFGLAAFTAFKLGSGMVSEE